MCIYSSNTFVNQKHEIRLTEHVLDVCGQGNFCIGGGGSGGGSGDFDCTTLAFEVHVSGCDCDRIFFVSFALMLCTFRPSPSTNFDSCHSQNM